MYFVHYILQLKCTYLVRILFVQLVLRLHFYRTKERFILLSIIIFNEHNIFKDNIVLLNFIILLYTFFMHGIIYLS